MTLLTLIFKKEKSNLFLHDPHLPPVFVKLIDELTELFAASTEGVCFLSAEHNGCGGQDTGAWVSN